MKDALVGNSSDREQLNRAEKRERLRDDQERTDFIMLMEMPEFRRFIWRLLSWTGVFRSIWSASAAIHYNSGMQDVGHKIFGEVMKYSPNRYLTMTQENQDAS